MRTRAPTAQTPTIRQLSRAGESETRVPPVKSVAAGAGNESIQQPLCVRQGKGLRVSGWHHNPEASQPIVSSSAKPGGPQQEVLCREVLGKALDKQDVIVKRTLAQPMQCSWRAPTPVVEPVARYSAEGPGDKVINGGRKTRLSVGMNSRCSAGWTTLDKNGITGETPDAYARTVRPLRTSCGPCSADCWLVAAIPVTNREGRSCRGCSERCAVDFDVADAGSET